MWEYNYTDPEEYIQHSSKSHKYLYKKVVNGKMRYFYDVGKAGFKNGNTNIGKDGQSTDSNVRGYTKFEDLIGKDERDARDRAVTQYERSEERLKNVHHMTADELIRKNIRVEAVNDENRYLGEEAIRKIDDFSKTPLGKLEAAQETIQKGKNAVADFLEKMAKKLRK